MDTGFNYYHGADPSEYDLVLSNSEGGISGCSSSARAAPRRSSGPPTRSSSRRAGREGARRLLLRLRRQVPARVDGGSSASRAARLPELDFALGGADFRGDIGGARVIGDVPFNVFPRAISSARDQSQRHPPRARDRARVVDLPAVRARRVPARRSSRTRTRGSSAGSSRAASCSSSRTRTRPSPRTASCSTIPAQAEEMGRARARARARRAHVCAPRAAPARAARPRGPEAVVAEIARPRRARRSAAAALRRVAIVPALNEEDSDRRA